MARKWHEFGVLDDNGEEIKGLQPARIAQRHGAGRSRSSRSSGLVHGPPAQVRGTEESVQTFLADPVLANLPAVQAGRVYPLGPLSFRVDYYSALDIIETVAPYFTE